MQYVQRSILLLICLLGMFVFFVAAQVSDDSEIAEIKYDKQSKIIGIYWSDAKPYWTCSKGYANLKLTKILYSSDEEVDQIESLIFTNSKGIREEFMFALNFSDYSTSDSKNLQSFLGQGNWYRVGAFRCGAGGNSDPKIFSLKKIITQKLKQKRGKK
jgi:hypothetical protein